MIWKIAIAWIAFDAIIYIWMWFDNAYYRCNFPKKFNRILNAFTEEVDEEE